MSSPALSRSLSPSLQSVTDLSDIGSASPVTNTASDSGNVVFIPSALDDDAESVEPAVAVARAPQSAYEETHELLESARIANLEAFGAKHRRYFFQSDFLTFLVEGTVYRVHSFLFTMMSPYWAQEVARGDRDGKPTRLDNVSVKEMDAFLSTLYPTDAGANSRTFADWSAVLRLATMWQFKDKRQLAITALKPITSPLQQLVLARAHDVEAWVHPAFVALCARTSTLSLEEAAQLSLQDVLHITSAREAFYKGRVDSPSQEDVSAYIVKHVHEPASPGPVLPKPRAASVSTLIHAHVASTRASPSPPALTLSASPTIEEKRTFAKLFSDSKYGPAIQAVQPHNVEAFCELLKEFSDVIKSYWNFGYSLLPTILCRGVVDSSFVLTGTQLLETLILTLPATGSSPSGLSQKQAKSDIKECYTSAQKLRSLIEEGLVKYEDFPLAVAHSILSDAVGRSPKILGLSNATKGSDQADYEQRSVNLRTFFAALVEAGLLEE